jgi:hypothetical protein
MVPNTRAHVFGNEVGEQVETIRQAWEDARTAAGITDLHFHDLRVRLSAARILSEPARRARLPGAREHHDDEHVSA